MAHGNENKQLAGGMVFAESKSVMKLRNPAGYFFFLCLSVLICWCSPLFAEESCLEEEDPVRAAEAEILTALNIARSDPWAEAERLGMDLHALRSEVVPEEISLEWDHGLWPLVRNDVLDEVARAHCEDMIQRNYFSHVSPEGLTPGDRVLAAGYPAALVREKAGALAFQVFFLDPMDAGRAFMEILLENALLQPVPEDDSTLLNSGALEVGIALCTGEIVIDNDAFHAYMLCIVLARPSAPASYLLRCGYFYEDLNGNGVYDSGEGISGVSMEALEGDFLAETGPRGEYCFRRPFDSWYLVIYGYPQYQPPAVFEHGDIDIPIRRDYLQAEFLGP